jgi:phosphate transport system permease protein
VATETGPEFGRVSRTKGAVFRTLSLLASVSGIVALAVLLAYVSLDAFDLPAASPGWLLTYFLTLVVPYFAFCLYSADDPEVTARTVVALAGGLIVVPLVFVPVDTFIRSIPRLNWQLMYLFVVALPMTGYVTVAAVGEQTGAVGFGFVGRLLGGAAIGAWIYLLFVVLDAGTWFLVYTLGILPAGALYALARWRESRLLTVLAAVVGVVGTVAGVVIAGAVSVFPVAFVIYFWTFVLPLTFGTGVLATRKHGRRTGIGIGAATFVTVVVGTVALGIVGAPIAAAMLFSLGVAVTTISYLYRAATTPEGRLGLALPVLLVGGTLVGALAVDVVGFTAPNPWLDFGFITGAPTTQTTKAATAGFFPAIVGSVVLITMVAILSFFFGVGTALFLEEYASDSGWVGTATRIIEVNIANLAGVPSVVYGLLGLSLFVQLLSLGAGSAISGALTLSLLILPITIVSSQEAIRAVPDDLRDGSLAMGATRWQTTKRVILPEALPGILTGVILALGRAIGETAPLIMIGFASISFSAPPDIFSRFLAMPMLIYSWSSNPAAVFRYGLVAAGVLTLLLVLIAMNATAIIIRNKYERNH